MPRVQIAALIAASAAAPALASLTLLSGPQQGSHTGNHITNGSFEFGVNAPTDGPGPIDRRFWATGTTLTPFSIPTGWSSSGANSTYATWGNDGPPSPNYTIQQSGALPDGRLGMYFGNGTGVTSDMPPTFHANGTVTYPGTPVITSPKGAPAVLWQTVPTNTISAAAYILSFWTSGEFSGGGTIDDGIFGLRVTNVLAGDPIQFLTVPGGGLVSKRYEYQFVPLVPSLPVTVEFINWGHFDNSAWAGPGFTTELVVDDVMINSVPAPGALGLLALAGLGAARRRR